MSTRQSTLFWRILTAFILCFALCNAALAQDAPPPDDPAAAEGEGGAPQKSEEEKKKEAEKLEKELDTLLHSPLDTGWAKSPERAIISQEIDTAKKNFHDRLTEEWNGKITEWIQAMIRRRRIVQFTVNSKAKYDFRIFRRPGGKELDWTNWMETPAKRGGVNAVIAEVRKEAEEHADAELKPVEARRKLRAEADDRFKPVKKGQRVSIILRNGRGTQSRIDNQPFRSKNDEYVKIGGRQIPRGDISEEDQAKFYPEVNERLKADFIKHGEEKIDSQRQTYIDNYCYKHIPEALLENNYGPNATRPNAKITTAKPEFWLAKKSFVETLLKNLIEEEYQPMVDAMVLAHMRNKGYVRRDNEWVTPAEVERRVAAQKERIQKIEDLTVQIAVLKENKSEADARNDLAKPWESETSDSKPDEEAINKAIAEWIDACKNTEAVDSSNTPARFWVNLDQYTEIYQPTKFEIVPPCSFSGKNAVATVRIKVFSNIDPQGVTYKLRLVHKKKAEFIVLYRNGYNYGDSWSGESTRWLLESATEERK